MVFSGRILIPRDALDRINKYLTEEPANAKECLTEDETILYTYRFSKAFEVDVKCCGVKYYEGQSNLAWSEAVLFKNGNEVCCTEPSDEFEGDWELNYGSDTFIVTVEPLV